MRPDIEGMMDRCKKATSSNWFLDNGQVKTFGVVTEEQAIANSNFIAHARSDLPACLAYIEELETALKSVGKAARQLDALTFDMHIDSYYCSGDSCGICKTSDDLDKAMTSPIVLEIMKEKTEEKP